MSTEDDILREKARLRREKMLKTRGDRLAVVTGEKPSSTLRTLEEEESAQQPTSQIQESPFLGSFVPSFTFSVGQFETFSGVAPDFSNVPALSAVGEVVSSQEDATSTQMEQSETVTESGLPSASATAPVDTVSEGATEESTSDDATAAEDQVPAVTLSEDGVDASSTAAAPVATPVSEKKLGPIAMRRLRTGMMGKSVGGETPLKSTRVDENEDSSEPASSSGIVDGATTVTTPVARRGAGGRMRPSIVPSDASSSSSETTAADSSASAGIVSVTPERRRGKNPLKERMEKVAKGGAAATTAADSAKDQEVLKEAMQLRIPTRKKRPFTAAQVLQAITAVIILMISATTVLVSQTAARENHAAAVRAYGPGAFIASGHTAGKFEQLMRLPAGIATSVLSASFPAVRSFVANHDRPLVLESSVWSSSSTDDNGSSSSAWSSSGDADNIDAAMDLLAKRGQDSGDSSPSAFKETAVPSSLQERALELALIDRTSAQKVYMDSLKYSDSLWSIPAKFGFTAIPSVVVVMAVRYFVDKVLKAVITHRFPDDTDKAGSAIERLISTFTKAFTGTFSQVGEIYGNLGLYVFGLALTSLTLHLLPSMQHSESEGASSVVEDARRDL